MDSPAPANERPIITLLSDFGTRDFYVPALKAVLLKHVPAARIIDITHHVPRHDILCGSITLERAVDGFPPGTLHLAVVDPGVGTDRRILVARIKAQTLVCPDNGLITWAWRRLGGGEAFELIWRPKKSSHTFHGRDIMAPAIARLARGEPLTSLARPIGDPVLLDIAPATPSDIQIIHLDAFGNATTNLDFGSTRKTPIRNVRVKGRDLGKLRKTYWDVAPGKPLALIGSSGLLEIAVRDGSAAAELGLGVGDQVQVK